VLLNHRPRNPPRAHGTFRGPFVWRRLLSDRCGRCVGGFLARDEDRFTNLTKTYSSSIFLMLAGSVLPQSLW